jgi:hypothetical protein
MILMIDNRHRESRSFGIDRTRSPVGVFPMVWPFGYNRHRPL